MFASQVLARDCFDEFVDENAFLEFVDAFDRFDDVHIVAMFAPGMNQRFNVFGETTAAVAAASVEEFIADTHVRANAVAHHVDVGADQFAEVRNVVHKGYASCKHRVCCIFGHLGGRYVHENHAEIVE